MKRLLNGWVCAVGSVSIAFVAAISVPQATLAATVTLDGQPVTSVVSHAGSLLIPFRAPMEHIGATVDYNKPTAAATMGGQQLVTVSTGDRNATIRGNPRVLSVAPSLINGVTYVPVDVLSSICGAHVAYSVDRQTATVTGCTLAGLNAAAVHPAVPAIAVPSMPPVAAPAAPNLWPWLIGLLILLALLGLIAWLLSRRKTIVTTNVYSQTGRVATETTPGAPRTTTGRSSLDDPNTKNRP